MLSQLCRHICQSRWIGQCLQEVRVGLVPTELDELERVERLVRMHDREGKAMQMLMVKLRLASTQHIVDQRRATIQRADQPPTDRPWEPVPVGAVPEPWADVAATQRAVREAEKASKQ
jgi:hypothetical protein